MATQTIAVLHGDQTGEELLNEALRLLEPGVLGVEVTRRDYDLSLEERRRTRNECVREAAEALRELGFGIKAATVTPEGSGDVGSPNAILRKQIDGRVIVRTGRESRGCARWPASTRRSPSSGWRSTTPTGPGSGGKATTWTSGRSEPRRSAAGLAAWW